MVNTAAWLNSSNTSRTYQPRSTVSHALHSATLEPSWEGEKSKRGTAPACNSCRGTSPHYKWDDSDPVSIRLSLLVLNDIALAGVSGEVMTMINEHLKKQAPSIHTVMVTQTNGSSGYIPDDAAFEPISYEITTSPLKSGGAENAILNGFLHMIEQR
jgi:hypothetical protein